MVLENYNCVKGTYENYGVRPETKLPGEGKSRGSHDFNLMLQTMNNYVDDNLEHSQIGRSEAYRSNVLSKSTNYPIDKASE